MPYLTNETIFALRDRPEHLLVIGGGPIGMEMAQAHRRLGCKVTVIEGAQALGREDPEMAAVVLDALRAEGIDIREGQGVVRLSGTRRRGRGDAGRWNGGHRQPSVDGGGASGASGRAGAGGGGGGP